MIVRKLNKKENSKFDLYVRYYSILSVMDSWELTERKIQLMAFTALKGNITYADIKEEFCKTYNSSNATINNIVSELSKKHLFVKDGDKVKINPKLLLKDDNNLGIIINLKYGD